MAVTFAQDAISQLSGRPLDAGEVAEAQALLGTVAGSATAKLSRVKVIDDVLLLGDRRVVYSTPAAVKARLGV